MKENITPKTGLEMAAQLFELARRDPGELSEMLLTDDTAVQVLQEGLTGYIKRAKSQIENTTDATLFLPKVSATYSIDDSELEAVDATLWFTQADDDELRNLGEEDYGGDSTSESIITFMAFFNSEVESLYFRNSDPTIVCHVNQEEAEAWIAVHRPHVLLEENDE